MITVNLPARIFLQNWVALGQGARDMAVPSLIPGALRFGYGGVLDVSACGVTIDRVVWNDLPADGTYSLGVMPPDAVGNDVMAAWCADTIDDDPVAPGLPGTPGVSNHPCP